MRRFVCIDAGMLKPTKVPDGLYIPEIPCNISENPEEFRKFLQKVDKDGDKIITPDEVLKYRDERF